MTLFLLANALIIVGFGWTSKTKKADYILILGSKVMLSGNLPFRLKHRLDKGLKLYYSNLAPTIIVSGGIGKEGFDEAAIMANYLIEWVSLQSTSYKIVLVLQLLPIQRIVLLLWQGKILHL